MRTPEWWVIDKETPDGEDWRQLAKARQRPHSSTPSTGTFRSLSYRDMRPLRVFISSVMRGYGAERHAAREAVLDLRQLPVLTEDLGARSISARQACLGAVRSADVFVGIFGARYGTVTRWGRSVMELEFDVARGDGKPILCFVQRGVEREAVQAEFVDRVRDFDYGFLAGHFTTPAKLRAEVSRSLDDLLATRRPGECDASCGTR